MSKEFHWPYAFCTKSIVHFAHIKLTLIITLAYFTVQTHIQPGIHKVHNVQKSPKSAGAMKIRLCYSTLHNVSHPLCPRVTAAPQVCVNTMCVPMATEGRRGCGHPGTGIVDSHGNWVLGTELEFSGREASVLSHRAISIASKSLLFKPVFINVIKNRAVS